MEKSQILTLFSSCCRSILKATLFVFMLLQASLVVAQAPNISYQTPQTYILNTTITPLTPANTGGAVPVTRYADVTTIAGGGLYGWFNTVTGVAVDVAGNVYFEDWGNHQIKKITPASVLSTLAGNSSSGFANGQGTAASFNFPDGIVIDEAGNLYVGDQNNHAIRKISPLGLVTTLAGNGTSGSANGVGAAASFNTPRGLAIDGLGNIYVADQANNLIRKVTPAGLVTTVAGNGLSGFVNGPATVASFNTPTGVGIDASGNLYVADAGNGAIRKITPTGTVTTLASNLGYPREVRVDAAGNLYVTDQQGNKIKKITPSGNVTILAGTGASNGNGASFNGPIGLALDGNGNLYVGDSGNSVVKKISLTGYTIDKPLPAGLSFDTNTGIISGTPTVLSPATDYTITAYNAIGSSSAIVNIEVLLTAPPLKPSVITFPLPVVINVSPDNILHPDASSTNKQTPITFTSSNTAVAYVGTDGQIHVIAPGITVITAYQKGNSNYSDANPVAVTFTIMQGQVIQFPAIAVKTTCDVDFPVGAISTNPLIALTYTSSSPAVATVSATGSVHIINSGTTTITASQTGNNLYYPAIAQTQILTVTALVKPSVSITPDSYGSCDGMELTYTATTVNAGNNPTYQWQLNGQNTGTNSASFTSNILKTGDIITCVATNNDGCKPVPSDVSNQASLTSSPNVTLALAITSTSFGKIPLGKPVTFKALPSNNVQQTPNFYWQVNGQNVGANSATFTTATLSNGDKVTCTMNAGGKCIVNPTVVSNTIVVEIVTQNLTALTIPNTFTPNGDGINDNWNIYALSAYPNCLLSVYNRYGLLVYQSKGYSKAWDGQLNGKPLPIATYYYIIDADGQSSKISGNVTILR